MLLTAQHVACAAKFEIESGDSEAGAEFAELLHGGETFAGDVRERRVGRNEQVSVRALVRTADSATELIQLGEAEAVGAVDQDGVGMGDVEAIFHHGSRL